MINCENNTEKTKLEEGIVLIMGTIFVLKRRVKRDRLFNMVFSRIIFINIKNGSNYQR